MFAISPWSDVTWIKRRPRHASALESEGWLFLSVRSDWDAYAFDRLLASTELLAIAPDMSAASQEWWCTFLRSYVERHELNEALRSAAGCE